jgi:hypothetical protein
VADTPISPSITWASLGLARQAAIILAVGWLAWIAAGFYVGDILHFVLVTFAFVTFRWWLNWPFWSALGSDRLAVVAWLSWTVPLLLTEFVVRSRRALPMSMPAD